MRCSERLLTSLLGRHECWPRDSRRGPILASASMEKHGITESEWYGAHERLVCLDKRACEWAIRMYTPWSLRRIRQSLVINEWILEVFEFGQTKC